MNFSEVVPPEDFTSKLTESEPSFSVTLQDFTEPASNLESLAKRSKLLKDLVHQMKHSQQECLQREQDHIKHLDDVGKMFVQAVFIFTDVALRPH